jgi:hypothetical protein
LEVIAMTNAACPPVPAEYRHPGNPPQLEQLLVALRGVLDLCEDYLKQHAGDCCCQFCESEEGYGWYEDVEGLKYNARFARDMLKCTLRASFPRIADTEPPAPHEPETADDCEPVICTRSSD